LVVATVTAAVAGGASARRSGTPNPFTTDSSRTASIHFVPLDDRARGLLDATVPTVKRWLSSSYPTEITAVATPKPAWTIRKRGQLDAPVIMSDLLARFRVARGRQSGFLVLVSSGSLYDPRTPYYQFVFGARPTHETSTQVVNILGTSNMRGFLPKREKARLTKMMLRYIGERVCRLSRSDDPRSVMYRTIISTDDLDRMVAKLPRRC
jgi:hypothetical protein